eukprot:maker-scaffold_2-snap-gene-20.36-mRNA-1 protein AED:0.07 eAED:0.08 QI:0/0/0/1/1/1/2/0/734
MKHSKKVELLEPVLKSQHEIKDFFMIIFLILTSMFIVLSSSMAYLYYQLLESTKVLITLQLTFTTLLVPLTHITGSFVHDQKKYKLFQPLVGGRDFVIFQALGWILYALSLAGFYLHLTELFSFPSSFTFFCVQSILSQVFILCSLLTFEKESTQRPTQSDDDSSDEEPDLWFDDFHKHYRVHFDKHTGMFFLFSLLNLLLLTTAIYISIKSFSFGTENEHNVHTFVLSLCSIELFAVCGFVTYGLGGALFSLSWRFFQPFAGGFVFSLLQALTWTCFALGLLIQFGFIYGGAFFGMKIHEYIQNYEQVGPASMLASYTLLILSFYFFSPDSGKERSKKDIKTLFNSILSQVIIQLVFNSQFVALFLVYLFVKLPIFPYEPVAAVLCSWWILITPVLTFPVCKLFRVQDDVAYFVIVIATILVGLVGIFIVSRQTHSNAVIVFFGLFMYYVSSTFAGKPEVRGCRSRLRTDIDSKKKFADSFLISSLEKYFKFEVMKDEKLVEFEEENGAIHDQAKGYVVGFHPHGILPASSVWSVLCNRWLEKFPNLTVRGHTASVIHGVPLMRDLVQLLGVKDVSREAITYTLKEGMSACIVVGGQAEMVMSGSVKKDGNKEQVLLHNGRKGFIKLAKQHSSGLIPLFCFGEEKVLTNVDWPKTQNWFRKRFGFPVPFVPTGKYGLPFPNEQRLVLLVGKPIPCEGKNVDELHKEYFTQLKDMHDRNRVTAGFPESEIIYFE